VALGRLLTRSTKYTVTDTVSGATATYTVLDNLAPDWPTSSAFQGAMSVPSAWSAALLISDFVGQVPWQAFRDYGGQPEEKLDPTPPLLEQPNPPDPRMATFSSWGLDLLWNGNAVGVYAARDAEGSPTAVYPVPAMSVAVRRVTPFMDSPLPIGALEYAIGALKGLGSQDVFHVKGPCEPGAVRGMGVLETQLNTLTLAADQTRQSRGLANNGVPTGLLKSANPDLTDDEALDLKKSWMNNQQSRTIAVLNPSTDFIPLSWNPEQMQLVEARRFTLNEMEQIFRLPVGWLGGTDSSRRYSNMSQDDLHLLKYTMTPHLTRFEQTLSLAFPLGTTVKANLDSVLRADTLSRYQAYQIALGGGDANHPPFLTVDEVREYENRPPLPDKQPEIPDAFSQEFPPKEITP
jgi:HK97 family phage portal protein